MLYVQRRSRVCAAETDSSELFRSFEHGWIAGDVPASIEYSRELAQFLENGIELTALEVDGHRHVSTWYLANAIVGADGKVTEFLVTQNADEEVLLGVDEQPTLIAGSYFVRFERRRSGWVILRRCVYYWSDVTEEHLEHNIIKMWQKLEVGVYSPSFMQRIYELFR